MAKIKKSVTSSKGQAVKKEQTSRHSSNAKACLNSKLETHLLEIAGNKHEQLDYCKEDHDEKCPCNTSSGSVGRPAKVDLIVLIDTSGSMRSKAVAIFNALDQAVKDATSTCNVNVKTTWLGIEGKFSNTHFQTTAREHLTNSGCPSKHATKHKEEGADTIADLAECPGIWREDSCRTIFYISDEPLDRGSPQDAGDTMATQQVIAAAQANNVSVFAHLAPGNFHNNPATIQNYQDLCQQTSGQAFIGNPATSAEYAIMLEAAICKACDGCTTVDFPEISPCFTVVWGDSKCDGLESNDFEVLLIKACNCYSNINFNQLMIGQITVTDINDKPIALLPNGNPSVEVIPAGPICFGTLAACTDGTPSCKAREIVVRTNGALAGQYKLKFENICFEVSKSFVNEACFVLEICKD